MNTQAQRGVSTSADRPEIGRAADTERLHHGQPLASDLGARR
jgi:hypothetical protein